ncbi:Uncharacterised protein [Mycobacterium tuberculosis]|nr:Uncharacterised protein [Mycobacterium tuberculosis]
MFQLSDFSLRSDFFSMFCIHFLFGFSNFFLSFFYFFSKFCFFCFSLFCFSSSLF